MPTDPRLLFPGLSPEQQAAWAKQFAPTNAPPASIAAPAPPVPVPMRPPAADPMEAALAQANGGARPAPPPARNLFAPINNVPAITGVEPPKTPLQAPRNGDWAGAHAGMVAQTAQINKGRLEGATFAEPGMDAPGPIAAGAGGGGAVRVIPGGRSPAQWHVKEGTPVPGYVKAEYEMADAYNTQAAGEARDAGVKQAEAEAGYLTTLSDAQKAHAFQEKIRQDANMSELANAHDDLAKYTKEAQEAPTYEDVYMLPGEAGKFVGALGVALGAGIAAATGGSNAALTQLNSAIQQSVDRQKRDVEGKVRNVDLQQNMIAKMKDRFGTVQAAEDATYLLYLERAKTDLARMGADAKSPEIKARYDAAMGELQGQIAQRQERFANAAADHIERTDVMTKPTIIGGGGMAAKPRKGLDDDVNKLAKFYADQKIPETMSQLEGIDRQIDTLGKDEIKGVGEVADKVYSTSPYAYKKLYGDRAVAQRQVYQEVRNELKKAVAGAAMSPEEKKALDAQVEGAKDSESMKRTVQSIRQRLYYQQRNAQASVPKDAVDQYQRNGGVIVTMERDKKLAPTIKPIGDK